MDCDLSSFPPLSCYEHFIQELESFKFYLDLENSNTQFSQEFLLHDPFFASSKSFLEKFLTSQPYIPTTKPTRMAHPIPGENKVHLDKVKETHKGNVQIKKLKSYKRSRPWTKADDQILMKVAISYSNDWGRIARRVLTLCKLKKNTNFLKNRFRVLRSDQCKNKVQFTEDEDRMILEGVQNHGKNWIEIAKGIPQREPLMIKNRYYYMKKKAAVKAE